MKRLSALTAASLTTDRGNRGTFSSSATELRSCCCSSALSIQTAGIRNLHQYPHARYKSLVRDRRRFARNWWLAAGNNYELVDEKGHEREATENFGEYRDDSRKDAFLLSTNRLDDLPAAQRLTVLVGMMKERWKVKDNNRGFDKAKLLLSALECFSEMRVTGQIKTFDELPEPDQDTFLQYVEGCAQFAQSCSHSHPQAVSVLLRAAQICDEMRCADKRDEMIHVAEVAAKRMDRAYAFARPTEAVVLVPPDRTVTEAQIHLRSQRELAERFKGNTSVLEKKRSPPYFLTARNRPVYHFPMNPREAHTRMAELPLRPGKDV